MDTNTLIADAKARFSHNSAKAYLKEKYQSKLVLAEQNGLWKADLETINFLNASTNDNVVLIDIFGNPVLVDRKTLLEKLQTTYDQVMREWYDEWIILEQKR